MTNKKLTKKSKWLKLALISTASLSTLATIPAAICAKSANTKVENKTTIKTSAPVVNTKLQAIEYVDVMFRIREEDKAEPAATLIGKAVEKVKKGRRFGAVKKPEAAREGYKFVGWSEEDSTTPWESDHQVTDKVTLYANFVPVGDITIKGKTTISMGEKVTFTKTSTPERDVEWYVNDGTLIPVEGGVLTPSSQYAKISNEKDHEGELTPTKISPEGANIYVFAIRKGSKMPDVLETKDPNVLKIEVVDPTVDPAYSDKIMTTLTIEGSTESHTYAMDPDQFYSTSGYVEGTELGSDNTTTIGSKDEFSAPLKFGKDVTVINDGFLPCDGNTGFVAFNNDIILTNVTHIGVDFLADNPVFNNPIDLPSTLLSIGDGFLSGCVVFDQTIAFSDDSQLFYIGNHFLSGCSLFAKTLVLPSSLKRVGEAFLYDAPRFKELILECETNVFDSSTLSFAIKGSDDHEVVVVVNTEGESFDDFYRTFGYEKDTLSRQIVGFDWEGKDGDAVIRTSDGKFFTCGTLENSGLADSAGTAQILIGYDEDGNEIRIERDQFDLPVYINPSLETISEGFLYNCSVFGQSDGKSIQLPKVTTSIGNNFLNGCSKFNSDITIHNKIERSSGSIGGIGINFLSNCPAMESTIRINSPVDCFKTSDNGHSFASNTEGAAYTFGMKIKGLSDADFNELSKKFPNLNGTDGWYRKLIKA